MYSSFPFRSLLLFPYGPISASRINLKSNCSYYAIVLFCAYLVECRPCVPLLWHLRCLLDPVQSSPKADNTPTSAHVQNMSAVKVATRAQ